MEPQLAAVRGVAGDAVGRDADRLDDVLQCVLYNGTAPSFAKQDADTWTIDPCPHRAIHGREVTTQFASVFRLENPMACC